MSYTKSYTTSARGFKHYEPTKTDHGHEVKVYESSAAGRPMLWLSTSLSREQAEARNVDLRPERATAHLSIHQAKEIAEKLLAAVENHYQLKEDR